MLYDGSDKRVTKKAYVKDFLNSKGFDLNFDDIEKLIEAAVWELKQDSQLGQLIEFEPPSITTETIKL